MRSSLLLFTLIIAVFFYQVSAQICPLAYFFTGQRCAPCKANCLCTQQNTCTSCLSGYTYDALYENCLQCPIATDAVNIGCQQCCYQVKGPAFVCSSCPAGLYTYQVGGQCIRLQGCTSITAQGVCSQCITGYFLNQGKCTVCDNSCASCFDSSLCLTCKAGYFNETNTDYSLCQACSAGCISCTSLASCTTCAQSYRISAGSCIACSSYCLVCTAAGCTTCNALSGLISLVCYLCVDTTKQGSIGCLTCTSTVTRIVCSSCAPGYFLNIATGACVQCSVQYANSILCNSSTPTQCSNDNAAILTSRYYLVSNLCVANTNNCKDMRDSTGKCSSCYFTSGAYYTLSATNICTICNVAGCLTYSTTCQCQSCQNGYQYINNQCIGCQNLHCYKCQASISSCQQCAPSYGRMSSACVLCQPSSCANCDGDSTICQICNNGYYLSGGRCYNCQSNCLTCLSNTQCSTCTPGTYLQNSGRCKTLPTNCLQIDPTSLGSTVGACKRCSYGFILMQGNCYPCSVDLFNLGLCDTYHCPNYYAQLKWDSMTQYSFVLILLIGLVLH